MGDDADQLGAQALRLPQLPVLLLELLLAPFEGRGHLVERRREVVDLCRAFLRKAHREIAAGHGLRSLRHAPHRVGDGTGQLDAEQQYEEHGDAERRDADEDRAVRLVGGGRDPCRRERVLGREHLRHLTPQRVEPAATFRERDWGADCWRAELGKADERQRVVDLVLANGVHEPTGARLLSPTLGAPHERRRRVGKVGADVFPGTEESPVARVDEAAQARVELQQILLQDERRRGHILRSVRGIRRRPQVRERDYEHGERGGHQHGEQRTREGDPRHERYAHSEGADHGQAADSAEPTGMRLLELNVCHRR